MAAFDAVYAQVAGSVYGLARRVTRNEAHAEEVTQETLIVVWRRAAQYDPLRGSAMAWIMTQAHRRSVDRVRSEQAHMRRNAIIVNTRPRPYDHVVEAIEDQSQREQLRGSLGSLTELQSQAIQLAYYQGYTYQEVAQLLDTPIGTLKSRLHLALLRLRETLSADE